MQTENLRIKLNKEIRQLDEDKLKNEVKKNFFILF